MRVGNKLFPYPVLNNSKIITGYKNSEFELLFDIKENKEVLLLENVRVNIHNDEIVNLINNGKIKSVLIIECSSTIFRETRDIGAEPTTIEINKSNLSSKVEISAFIYANEDITLYSDDFLDDYEGFSFDIKKHDLIAIDDGSTLKIDNVMQDDKKVSSIFSVIKSENAERMEIYSKDSKIEIHLPIDEYDAYNSLKSVENYQNKFFAILTVPALIYSLMEIVKDYDDLDTAIMDHSWLKSISKAYQEKYGKELTLEYLREDKVIVDLSQSLMNDPVISSIDDIVSEAFMKDDGE